MNDTEQSSKPESNSASVSRRAMYYGSSGKRAHYYGGNSRPVYYGASSPAAYYPSGGAGGSYYYGGVGGGGGDDDDSLMGAVTIGRMLRVCSQRWVTIVVFVIIGFIAAFAVFKISPMIYEAESVFEMSIRGSTYTGMRKAIIETDMVNSLDEVFNTRLARLRSRAALDQIVSQYVVIILAQL